MNRQLFFVLFELLGGRCYTSTGSYSRDDHEAFVYQEPVTAGRVIEHASDNSMQPSTQL